jgi:hypothetical protein
MLAAAAAEKDTDTELAHSAFTTEVRRHGEDKFMTE